MRIAQVTASYYPVEKNQNKAIYSHVAWLSSGLVDLGHSVDLYASPKSKTEANLITCDFKAEGDKKTDQKKYEQWALLSDCYKNASLGKYDLIHTHFNVMSAFFADLVKAPTLISIHSPIEDWMKPILHKYKHLNYVSFSRSQRNSMPELNWVANIYHGVDTNIFTYNPNPQDYFLFIGRITGEKGPHEAIVSAIEAGVNIQVAGASYETENYWHQKIAPYINGNSVRYLGDVSFDKKIPLFQNAKAVLFPTQFEEPFGYVMIEAMACGTPVIAYGNGSVPEIVKDGVTGYIVNSVPEMVKAIKKIDKIDRAKVRKRAELFFSCTQMVENYETVYRRIIKKYKSMDEKE
ncbi:MAG TPA: glycosyltransferase family 4 protein [Candidatus Paceibacterota bacterium]|nr:glycosyltransferase family 4 protein [Candidatus Paceibacterota bacterium]HMP19143.1 glycosyltransferase family 4 protein [Candidatus Paceibacterota bacterium]HMP85148.1 glycosyltransferase family 4 protein [Candidatus Paceibacterota bacterium]